MAPRWPPRTVKLLQCISQHGPKMSPRGLYKHNIAPAWNIYLELVPRLCLRPKKNAQAQNPTRFRLWKPRVRYDERSTERLYVYSHLRPEVCCNTKLTTMLVALAILQVVSAIQKTNQVLIVQTVLDTRRIICESNALGDGAPNMSPQRLHVAALV